MALLVRQVRAATPVVWLRAPALLVPVATLALGVRAAFTVDTVFATRALPGVTVAGVPVGSLQRAAVRERLASEMTAPWAEASVVARDDGTTWRATNAELGIAPDLEAATDAAMAYGKAGSPVQRLAAWLGALTGQARLPFVLRAQDGSLDRQVAGLASAIDQPARDGEISVAQGLVAREPVAGRSLDRAATRSAYLTATALGDREFDLPVRAVHPALDDAGFAEAAAAARAATIPLSVVAEGRSVDETAAALATLLMIERVAARPGELPPLPRDAVAPSVRYRYHVALDEARVRTWVAAVAAALDRPARSASYAMRPDGTFEVVPGEVGVRVDQEALVAQALRELVRPLESALRLVAPSFVAEVPAFTTEQAERYAGQMTEVTSFETFFPANLARWKNISTGASQFNGLVIGPGETFSFWELLGPVTVQRGYAFAGAIVNGRSQDDVIGGGLCQVSTTLFNAVASAGYEILERGAHSYYIDRYPLGLDAAVFDPGADLKWRNDTAFPVFIRSSTSNIAVEFEIFTVPSGRTVSFGAPVQYGWRDVAPGQAADPHFPPGSKVLGRTVTRTRVVSEEGRVVHEDVWVSRYAPVWGGPASAN